MGKKNLLKSIDFHNLKINIFRWLFLWQVSRLKQEFIFLRKNKNIVFKFIILSFNLLDLFEEIIFLADEKVY